jgi:hypothetical protein
MRVETGPDARLGGDWGLEKPGLPDEGLFYDRLEDFAGDGEQGSTEGFILGARCLNCEDGHRYADGEAAQLFAAGPENAHADGHGNIGGEEVVEEVEDEEGGAVGAGRLEQVQELVATEGTGQADAV